MHTFRFDFLSFTHNGRILFVYIYIYKKVSSAKPSVSFAMENLYYDCMGKKIFAIGATSI